MATNEDLSSFLFQFPSSIPRARNLIVSYVLSRFYLPRTLRSYTCRIEASLSLSLWCSLVQSFCLISLQCTFVRAPSPGTLLGKGQTVRGQPTGEIGSTPDGRSCMNPLASSPRGQRVFQESSRKRAGVVDGGKKNGLRSGAKPE